MDDSNWRLVSLKGGRVGVVIITSEQKTLKHRVQLTLLDTNNEAEYEGILLGLRDEKALGAKNLLL